MEARAQGKHIKMSAEKVRQVIELIKYKSVKDALAILKYTNKRAAAALYKVVHSAFSNLKNKDAAVSEEQAIIMKCCADVGPTLMRFKPMAMGRAGRMRKRTCHITVVVTNEKAGGNFGSES